MIQFPSDFVNQIQAIYKEESEDFLKGIEKDPSTSIRINTNKNTTNKLSNPIPWCEDAFFLKERPFFTLDPTLHAGGYYVQDASSMFIKHIIKNIKPEYPVRVLDLCAAPGGKSTLLASCLDENDLLVANEVIKSRAQILKENLQKWGFPNVIVTSSDPSQYTDLEDFFDIILVDAPCSGEGLFRKDKDAMNEWSLDNINLCSQRQQRIIADIWPSLANNGFLIYSTCTFNDIENEGNLKWITENNEATPIQIPIEPSWNITETHINEGFGYKFLPHKVSGEGFFVAVFQKNDGDDYALPKKIKNPQFDFVPKKQQTDLTPLLIDGASFEFFNAHDGIYAIKQELYPYLNALAKHAYVILPGIEIGELTPKGIKPGHGLALSTALNKNAFQKLELTYSQAISYLKKEEFNIESSENKSWILLTYKDLPIGFGKIIGNRFNNYYPKEWRIRTSESLETLEII